MKIGELKKLIEGKSDDVEIVCTLLPGAFVVASASFQEFLSFCPVKIPRPDGGIFEKGDIKEFLVIQ